MQKQWGKQLATLLMVAMTLLSVGIPVAQAAAPPNIVTYQGRVLNSNGVPVTDSSLNMRFWLYTAASGGTCVWSNSSSDCDSNTPASATTKSVSLTTGLFTQNLGDTSDSFAAISDSVFGDNTSIYLAVEIAGETLSPRKQLTAAPYAISAQTLDGIDSTGFLASTGDTATGDYDFTGAVFQGSGPLLFEGATADAFETEFSFNDPTADRVITFQDASGTVAFQSEIYWENGANGIYNVTEATLVGGDIAFSYADGNVSDLLVADEIEVLGDGYFDNDLIVGASTSVTETLSNGLFSIGGNDLFVAGDAGVEGSIYVDGGFVAGSGTILTDGSLSTAGSTDLTLTIAGGDILFDQTTELEIDGSEDLVFENKGTGHIIFDLQSTGDIVFKDNGSTELTWTDGGLLAFDPSSEGLSMAGVTLDLDADRDTSISAGTDDTINIELGGVANSVELKAPQLADAASSAAEAVHKVSLATPADTTGNNIHMAMQVDLDIGNATGGTNTAIGFGIDNLTGDAQVNDLYGIMVGDLTGTAATNEIALRLGGGWDAAIAFTDASNNQVTVPDSSQLSIRDDGGADIAIFKDLGNSTNHIIAVDADTGLMFDSASDTDADITTLNNEDLAIIPAGTGDTVFAVDGDTGVNIVATATTDADDLLAISNNGFSSSTDGTNGLDVTFGVSNASGAAVDITPSFSANGSDLYSAINVQGFSASATGSNNTLAGLSIGTVTGVDSNPNLNGAALVVNGGWDAELVFNDTTPVMQIADGFTWNITDGTNNMMSLQDNGLAGILTVNTVTSTSILDVTGGNSIGTNKGGNVQINAGVNAGDPSGGEGGDITIESGAGVGNGTVARDGGDIAITSGSSNIGTGSAGDIDITAGNSTSGTGGDVNLTGGSSAGGDGNIYLVTGGSPTAVPVNGGDVGITSKDDFILSSDDDFSLAVTSASAVVNLFDNNVVKSIDIGGVNNDGTDTIKIATNNTSADNIEIGNNNASTVMSLTGGNDWYITSSGTANFNIPNTGSYTAALCWDNSGSSEIQDCVGSVNADYAEMFPVEEGATYGDLMMLGTQEVTTTQGDTITQLVKAQAPYQESIVGIIANNYGDFSSTGYNIAEEDNPKPIALVGRVPVNVVAEGGSISIGDYLTTSSTPGAAMKATGVGRVIGMAIEDWDGVSSTVMVQVHNSFYMGDILEDDGSATNVNDNIRIAEEAVATSSNTDANSYGLSFRGSAWNGSEAEAVEMMLQNVVDDEDNYRLSISNTAESEVAYITNEGTMRIAGDMVIAGRLYPSDRGEAQTEKYIFYDGSSGAGGDMMRTNAKGWGAGSYDFAEMFPSGQSLMAGEVVAFSGNKEEVHRSTGAEGERLAGIVSTRPGFLAGENSVGSHPIALAGRVPTFVSAENGTIEVGDALTASSTAGIAMKATEEGQIIGYALERYTGSESDNLIVVFVNVGDWNGVEEADVPGTQNVASQSDGGAKSLANLNMTGDIFLGTHNITGVGRLAGIGGWSIEADGTIKTDALLKTIIKSHQGTQVETAAVTSPEVLITLTGTSELKNGQVEVRFEDVLPEYNDVISAIAPIRVVVTPNGPSSLYVSEKDQNHFVVKSFAGDAFVEFDWMVTAYRKGYEPEVTEVVVDEVEAEAVEITETTEEETTTQTDTDETENSETTDESDTSEDTETVEEEVVEETVEDVTEEPESTEEEVIVEEEPADEVTEQTEEPEETEEPATPESPDETLIDSTSQDDGGEPAEEPSDS